MINKTQLQDPFLNAVRRERVPLSIYLVNGIKLQGVVDSFDQYAILLMSANVTQMVYKHAISTMVPSRKLSFRGEGEGEENANFTPSESENEHSE